MRLITPFVSSIFLFLVVFFVGKNFVIAIYCGVGSFIVGLALHYFFDKKWENK